MKQVQETVEQAGYQHGHESLMQFADSIAAYYKRLVDGGVAPDHASRLTLAVQDALMSLNVISMLKDEDERPNN